MATITEIEGKVLDFKTKAESYLSEEDIINEVLDGINRVTSVVNKINDSYSKIFELLDKLSKCEVSTEKDINSLKEILNQLSVFSTTSSINFAKLSKNSVLSIGCKSSLEDLRSNIRTLREYIEDIELQFFLNDEDELNELISDLI